MCVILCAATYSRAQDGNQLLEQCNFAINFVDAPSAVTSQQGEAGMYCLGFVRGILDTVALWQTADALYKNRVSPGRPCLPEGISTVQGVRIVVKYLKDHPEKLHYENTLLVMTALKGAFPCR